MDLPIDPVTSAVSYLQKNNFCSDRKAVREKTVEILGDIYTGSQAHLEPFLTPVIDSALKGRGKNWGRVAGCLSALMAVAGGIRLFYSSHWSSSALLGVGIVGGAVSMWPKSSAKIDSNAVERLRTEFMRSAANNGGWVKGHLYNNGEDMFWPEYGAVEEENEETLLKYRAAYGCYNVGQPFRELKPESCCPDYHNDAEIDLVLFTTALQAGHKNVKRPDSVDKEILNGIVQQYRLAAQEAEAQHLLQQEQDKVIAQRRASLGIEVGKIDSALGKEVSLPDFLTPWLNTERGQLEALRTSCQENGNLHAQVMNGNLTSEALKAEVEAAITAFTERKNKALVRGNEARPEIQPLDVFLEGEDDQSLDIWKEVTFRRAEWVQWASGGSDSKPLGSNANPAKNPAGSLVRRTQRHLNAKRADALLSKKPKEAAT
jgi:hypothetical protein